MDRSRTFVAIAPAILLVVLSGCSERAKVESSPQVQSPISVAGSDKAMLDLSGKDISSLPDDSAWAIGVHVLRLGCNERLVKLPPYFSLLKDVEELNIDNGNACQMNLVFSPEEKLPPNLRKLSLSGALSESSSIPLSGLGALEELDLSRTERKALPEDVLLLAHLRTLRINFMGLVELPDRINALGDLEELYVAGNNVSAAKWPDMTTLKRLRVVDLSSTLLSKDDKQAIRMKIPPSTKIYFEDDQ